jgi:hypothetical protein
MFQVKPEETEKEKAKYFGKIFCEAMTSLSDKLKLHRASDEDLMFFGQESYLTKIGGHVDDAKIESQLGGSFDVLSMLGKPSPPDPK